MTATTTPIQPRQPRSRKPRKLFRHRLDADTQALFDRARAGELLTPAEVDHIMMHVSCHYTFRMFVDGSSNESGALSAEAIAGLDPAAMAAGHRRLLGRGAPLLRKTDALRLACSVDVESGGATWEVCLNDEVLATGSAVTVVGAARLGGLELEIARYARMPVDPWANVVCCERSWDSPPPWDPLSADMCEKRTVVREYGEFNEKDRCHHCGLFTIWERSL